MNKVSIELIYQKLEETGFNICTDTRKLVKDTFFICLSGDVFDGNSFAMKALELGAKYIITNNSSVLSDKVLHVENPNATLAELAKLHASKLKGKIQLISIGGSNGKTTTKELLTAIFQEQYSTKATKGNLNNHIGVPMTLLSFDENTDFGIVELGTNHPGEMSYLCDLFQPNAGLITNIGKEHLEGFGSIESVAKEESELYMQLIRSKGKVAINLDDEWLQSMSKRFENPFTYSIIHSKANLYAEILEEMPNLKFKLYLNEKLLGTFRSKLGGKYNVYNILAALSISVIFELDLNKSIQAVCMYEPKNNRSQWLNFTNYNVFLDAYNANPSSMQAGLQSFATLAGSKAALLGDMLELGDSSESEHLDVFEFASNLGFDELFLVGSEFKNACKSYPYCFDSVESLLAWLDTHPVRSRNVYVKGSRGIAMEKVIEHFQIN